MKNSRMFKMLAFLTSALIFSTNSSSLIFAMPKLQKQFKGGIEFKKPNEKFEEDTKKFIEDRLNNNKISDEEDKKLYERNLEVFKDFKEQYCETENYDVEIYYKNGVPIVVYKHKITGTIIVFLPINNENFCPHSNIFDNYFFRATEQNDKGIAHLAEHCLLPLNFNKEIKEKFKDSNFGLETDDNGLYIEHKPDFSNNKEELEKLVFKMLLNNDISEQDFEREKRRAIIEITKNYLRDKRNDVRYDKLNSRYNSGGIPEEMEKATISDVINFLKKYKHPSNLLIIKNIRFNPSNLEFYKQMREFLEKLEKNYLKYFKYKPIEIKKITHKKQKPYERVNVSLCNDHYHKTKVFEKNGISMKDIKYTAVIENKSLNEKNEEKYLKNYLEHYYLKTMKLNFLNKTSIEKEINDFVKNLGYEGCEIINLGSLIYLKGNNPNLFTEKALKENYKKIFDFISSKFEKLTEEDIKLNSTIFFKYNYSNKNAPENKNNVGLNSSVLLYNNRNMNDLLKESFYNTSNPIHKAFFNLTDKNEIKSTTVKDVKNALAKIKELNNSFNNPYIKVYEYEKLNKLTKEQLENEEDFFKETFYPIKLADFNNNIFLGYLVKEFLVDELNLNVVVEYGINYYNSSPTKFYDRYAAMGETPSDNSRNSLLNHIYKNFKFFKENLIKPFKENLKIIEKEFEELKNKNIEYFKGWKERFKNSKMRINEIASAMNSYLNNANELDEKNGFSITKTTTRRDLFKEVEHLFIPMFHEKFEDYLEKLKLKREFYEKYGQVEFNYKDILVDKEFVQDLKDAYITPLLKDIEKFKQDLNKAVEEINKIEFKDFKKAVESVTLVEKEQHEKDQKKYDEFLKSKIFLVI